MGKGQVRNTHTILTDTGQQIVSAWFPENLHLLQHTEELEI